MKDPTHESGVSPAATGVSDSTLAHFGRGVLMGSADVLPGISGGTIALILRVYERLITAISRVDRALLGMVRAGRWRAAAGHLDLAFLIPLGVGILCGVAMLGTLMHTLFERHLQLMYAVIFGMIAASCYLVGRLVVQWRKQEIFLLLFGAIFAFWLMGLSAVSRPPTGLWYVFFCGFVGISAMILPGVSGAFLLVILGKYHELTGIIKQTMRLEVTMDTFWIVVVFVAGCLTGLATFSKVLKWLLAHHGSATMALMCGFMAGSLRLIWPFQVDLTPEVSEFKEKIFESLPLSQIPIDGHFWLILLVTFGGMALVLLLERSAVARARQLVRDDAVAGDRADAGPPA